MSVEIQLNVAEFRRAIERLTSSRIVVDITRPATLDEYYLARAKLHSDGFTSGPIRRNPFNRTGVQTFVNEHTGYTIAVELPDAAMHLLRPIIEGFDRSYDLTFDPPIENRISFAEPSIRFPSTREMLDGDLESRRQRRLAFRVDAHDTTAPARYVGVRAEDRGLLIGPSYGGICLDGTKRRGPLCKVLFEQRLARLGLHGDYSTECIKWLGNE